MKQFQPKLLYSPSPDSELQEIIFVIPKGWSKLFRKKSRNS